MKRMDNLTPERRSWLMSRVKAKNSMAEQRVRKTAYSVGLRYRLHRRDLPGTPDLLFPKHRIAMFVHGCFWHRHPGCPKATTPKSRVRYWKNKFKKNVDRDRKAIFDLDSLGWKVLVIWECETRLEETILSRLCEGFGKDLVTDQAYRDDHVP